MFFVLGVRGVDLKKFLEPRSWEKNFLRARRGSRGMLP